MKFLKLQLTDFELYSLEGSARKAEYLFSNMPAFRRLYCDQGEMFWIRHLLTLREYLHILIQARFEIEAGQCLHWVLIPVDKIFMRIHRLLFAGGFDTAKENIKIMKKVLSKLDMLPSIIGNRNCRLILSNSIKASFRTLFGTHLGHDKKAVFKAFLMCGVYEAFIGTLGVLLRRSDTAVEMPSSYSDESPNVQYWQPFPYWKNYEYEPNPFETYIAQHYGEQLQKMLLIKNIHMVFQRNIIHQCCISFIEEHGTVLMNEHSSHRLKKEYAFCTEHSNCRIRISHSDKCKNPYIKCLEPECAWLCDTICMETKVMLHGKNKNEWKHQSVSIHKNSRKHRRDVGMQVEAAYNKVETYVFRHSNRCDCSDESSDSPHFFESLPPDLINFAKQVKRKEKTKSRLRDKLSKKTKKNGKIEDILHCYQMENSDNPEYYSNLLKRAQKKLNEELGEDFLYKNFGIKVGQSDTPLLDLFDTYFETEPLNFGHCHSHGLVNSNYRSIGVGNDVPLDLRFLSIPKVMHVKKKLKGLVNKYSSKKENTHTSDMSKKTDENACSTGALAKDDSEKMTVNKNSDSEKSETVNLEKQENSVKTKKHKKSKRNGKKCKKKDAENAVEEIIIKSDKQGSSETLKNIEHTSDKISDMQNSTSSSEDKIIDAEVEKKELKSTENAAVQTNFEYVSNHLCEETNGKLLLGKNPEKISGSDEFVLSKENEHIDVIKSNKQEDITKANDDITDKKDNSSEILQEIDKNETKEQKTPDGINLEKNSCESPGLHSDNVISDGGKDSKANSVTEADDIVKSIQLINKKKLSNKLHFCANCGKEEPARRTFQKCKLCKEHQFEVQRYYCSIECQANDWKLRHKEEHKNR